MSVKMRIRNITITYDNLREKINVTTPDKDDKDYTHERKG